MSSFPFFLRKNWFFFFLRRTWSDGRNPNVEISRPLNGTDSNILKHNSTCVDENIAKKSISSWPFFHFCNYCSLHLLWSIYYANPIGSGFSIMISLLLLWVQSSLETPLRVHPKKKGNEAWGAWLAFDHCSPYYSCASPKPFGMLSPYKIISEKISRLDVFFILFLQKWSPTF